MLRCYNQEQEVLFRPNLTRKFNPLKTNGLMNCNFDATDPSLYAYFIEETVSSNIEANASEI